jgi:hypothetical protein
MIDLAHIALEVAGKALPKDKKIWIEGPDITERDNRIPRARVRAHLPNALSDLYDRGAHRLQRVLCAYAYKQARGSPRRHQVRRPSRTQAAW